MLIPIPTHNEPDLEQPQHKNDAERDRYIRWYMDCPSWKCDKCGAVMFGRMKYCVYCKLRLGVDTLRPTSYVENTYERDNC
jgi:hypothetical protein